MKKTYIAPSLEQFVVNTELHLMKVSGGSDETVSNPVVIEDEETNEPADSRRRRDIWADEEEELEEEYEDF